MPLIFDFLRQIFFFAGYIGGAQSFKKPLSPEKETEYIEKMQKGDEKARDMLIEHNLRLVAHIAKKYAGAGVDMDDLISIGTIGLIKAVGTFSYEKSRALSSYAAKCIENEILMHIRKIANQKTEVSLEEPINMDGEGNELGGADLDREVLDMSVAGRYVAVLCTDRLIIYDKFLTELASLPYVSQTRAVFMRNDGSAVLAGAATAGLYLP